MPDAREAWLPRQNEHPARTRELAAETAKSQPG